MHTETLVKMANQIGLFFDAMPDRQEAVNGVAQHIRKSWTPAMRNQFMQHVDAGGAGLLPLVQQSMQVHRSLLV